MNEFLNKIKETTKQIAEAQEAYKNAVKDAVEPTLDHIAKEYGDKIDLITILGYTPGFNDGDPCEHGSDYGFGFEWLANYGLEDVVEDLVEDEEDVEQKIEELMSKEVVVPEELKNFVGQVLDPFYKEKHETDYIVYIFFENGTYRIVEDEYDCGY